MRFNALVFELTKPPQRSVNAALADIWNEHLILQRGRKRDCKYKILPLAGTH